MIPALRPYQRAAIDALYDYFGANTGNPLVVMPTGCHAAGTMILMHDGSTKRVEDVAEGDLLMGPDSRPRRVLRLARGRERMWRVIPKRGGDAFVVNEGHILSLARTNEKSSRRAGQGSPAIDNISIREYLGKPKSWRHLRKLRRVAVDFPERAPPELDAWVLGALLGDGGLKHGVRLTNPDPEVFDGVLAEMERHGLHYRARMKERGTCWDVAFTDPEACRGRPNHVTAMLRELGLSGIGADEKFIPDTYKLGSRDVRLGILAGLLDTDGHLNGRACFDYISKSERLARDVAFVARSLGLSASCAACQKHDQNGTGGTYWRVTISGDTDIIPTRVARKRAAPRRQKKNPLVTGFDLQALPEDDYYGFLLDGDHLYLTADFTVHHNTGKSVVLAAFIREAIAAWPETRILVLTHVKELIAQNFQALLRLWPDAPAGVYSAGLSRRDIRAQVLFAGIQSIHRHADRVQRCDLVLIDEAHLLGRSDNSMYRSFLKELDAINAGMLKVIGFTATPYRLDSGLLHEGKDRLFTDIAYEVPVLDMIRQGYLCPVVPKRTGTQLDVTGVGTRGGEYIARDLEAAVDRDEVTQAAAAEIVRYGADRGSWLVFCAGVAHARHVRDAIRGHGISCETVTGDTPAPERDAILAAFKAGRLRCVTNANVLTTGFDAPGTDLIALLRPTKSVGLYVQMVGRGTRLAEGKEDCLVLDFAGNTARHGPIDMVDGRKRETTGDSEAPVKVCPVCETISHASARRCSGCDHEFPPPVTKIAPQAASDALLSIQRQAEWCEVLGVGYARHEKPGKPPSLRVTYQCGLIRHSEWVCFEHEGYPRQKAEAWWRRRAGTPVPGTVGEALARTPELRRPTAIQVRPVGKYTEITAVRLA
ncbi:Hint domain-containing homing endonuclease [Crenalkalicoccus roseus]|uniref:Hint domain-containing homing endonuclease n=1 Tax=Crenalkalicoccus roseus TaxID=1485588 RepID=UPI001081F462|nr:Hint domain-containing homing endonuclease [Crenalkalicoccus roseus]